MVKDSYKAERLTVDYSTFGVIKRIFKNYVVSYRRSLSLAVFFMIIVATSDAFLIWLIKPSLDGIFIGQQIFLLRVIPLLVIAVALIKGVADYGQSYLIKSIGQGVVNALQLDLYSQLIKSDLDFLNQQSSGHMLSKFTNDIANIKLAITSLVVNFAKDLFMVVLLVGIMFYNDYKLSIAAFVIFPLIVWPILKSGKNMKRITYDIQGKLAEYVKYLNERLHNVKLIKACCSEKYEIKKSNGYLNEIFRRYKKAIKLDSIVSPLMEICSSIAVASIITYGGYSVANHTSTPGSLFAFISAFIVAYKPIKSIAAMNMILQAGIASAKRILITLDRKNIVEDNKNKAELTVRTGHIEFQNIYFSYDDKKPVLQDLSLKIEPKQVVAIVGESGSGKSTLIDLLLKFYEPTSGNIYVDNQNLETRSTTSIRRNIALVPQEAMLFDVSIRDNISYGDVHSVSQKKIYAAAEVANAQEFIESMPQQYDTIVGKFGIKLSGGQRQRIAIARAVLTEAPILVLDEATSSLDQVSEQHVKNSIFNLKSRCKAIIIITHRLSTIVSSDVIHVIKNGQVVESGTHEDLLKAAGEYYRLYHKKILV